MNAACSSCLELFTSRCNISTTPCGHVFHTECITEWLENQQENCAQCRQSCHPNQITKLYFSEGDQENNLVAELLEENLKLQTEANTAKSETIVVVSENLRLQTETNEIRSDNLKLQTEVNTAKSEMNVVQSETLKLQIEANEIKSENLKLQTEVNRAKAETNVVKAESLKLQTEANKVKSENLKLQSENLNLVKHLDDIKKNFNNIERNFHRESKKLTKRALKAENKVDKETPLHVAASKGNSEIVRTLLGYGVDKDAKEENGWTPLHIAAKVLFKYYISKNVG